MVVSRLSTSGFPLVYPRRKGKGAARTGDVWQCHVGYHNDPDNTDDYHAMCLRKTTRSSHVYQVTYKPATVKMDVKMICCLRVTLRRQRSGIGFPVSIRCCMSTRNQEMITKMKIRALRQTFAMPLPIKKAWKLTQVPFEVGSNKSH